MEKEDCRLRVRVAIADLKVVLSKIDPEQALKILINLLEWAMARLSDVEDQYSAQTKQIED